MNYFSPNSISELFNLFESIKNYTILVGGTDLMPGFENGTPLPENLIDLKNISDLSEIRETTEEIEIGALTTVTELQKNLVIHKYFNALWQATKEFAGVQIRNRATIGGNICNASPSGDLLTPLYSFGAKLKLIRSKSERIVPIENIITNPGEIALNNGEILQSVILPKTDFQSLFIKLGLRESMAISVVNFAIVYKKNCDNFEHLSIFAGAVAPTIIRLKTLENVLLDNPKTDITANLIVPDISPISDIRASANYREQVLVNLLNNEVRRMNDEQ
ncbi:MAG: FAD binding domain-containing protein [Candidatus Marinimicrobia bacterium]|nr:FAD binding domain-containing protein [Candidatus Neomarinimicrobiota bacterium]MBL7053031.1 FAD binding domain-containing protein [Candidatus Neomarinimicrobiota bacterium]MBL7108966.1 FAD binding domain-containing protein [Candidatus Neomarinimicrobiota bacterium]